MMRLVGRVFAEVWSAPAPRPPPAIGVDVQPTTQYLFEYVQLLDLMSELDNTPHTFTFIWIRIPDIPIETDPQQPGNYCIGLSEKV